MGVAERREREREQLRSMIVDAARDLLLEQGLAGLSMRAIAERVEYSPATIYLYFRDKDELTRAVVHAGFERLQEVLGRELEQVGVSATWPEQYRAMGRAYARFALENPAYFRVMFELPSTAQLCGAEPGAPAPETGVDRAEQLIRRAVDSGQFWVSDARQTALIGWGLIHGLTSLYLSGHLAEEVTGPEAFHDLIEAAMKSAYEGWAPERCGEEEE